MNFQFLISAFFFDLLFFNTKIYSQTEYYLQGETKFLSKQSYFVPFQQNLLDQKENQFNIELIHEIKLETQPTIVISEKQKLFYFQQLTAENDNIIMVIDNSNLICLYLIKNYLLNQQLIITPHFCNKTLPYQSCNKILQVNKEIFISKCQLNNNQIAISIINLDGQVFDEIKFDTESNCTIEITYGYSYIFLYGQHCKSDQLYQIEIDEKLFLFKVLQKLELNNITNSSQGQIVQIDICNQERIYLIYEKLILHYKILQGTFTLIPSSANSITLKAYKICTGRLILLEMLTESKQLRFDKNLMNISNFQFLNSMVIKKILVLHYNDQIVATINDQVTQSIKIVVPEIIPLIGLPYFFGICNSEFRLFQIQQPKFFHSFNKSQNILFLTFFSNTTLHQFDLVQQNIEIISESEPKLIINKQELILYSNHTDEICVEQSKISKTLPIKLEAIIINQQTYQIIQSNIYQTCLLKLETNSKIIHFNHFKEETIIVVLFKQKNKIKIILCKKKEIILQKNINIKNNIIDYVIQQDPRTLIIFYEQRIELITLDILLQTKIIKIKDYKILQVAKYFHQVNILFDNCKTAFIFYNSEEIVFNERPDPYPFNCTLTLQFNDNKLFISQNEIFFLSNPNQRYILEEKIIQVFTDIQSSYYIFVLKQGNEIIIKLFRYLKDEFIFVYKLPSYNFMYSPSSIIKYDNHYLMISAENSNKLYLLLYNLKNQAIDALIFVTEIDQSQEFFQLLDDTKTLVYFKDEQFHFHNFNQNCFNFSFELENNLITQKQAKLVISSAIHNLSTSVNCQLLKLHNDYSLNTFNEKIINIFDENTFDWDKISGNIVKLQIQPIQDFSIQLPLNISQEGFTCNYYQSNICLDQKKFEIKSLNLEDDLPFKFVDVDIKYILFNEESLMYTIFFTHQLSRSFQYLIIQLEKISLNKFKIIKQKTMQFDIPSLDVSQIEKIKFVNEIIQIRIFGYYNLFFYKNICKISGLFQLKKTQYYIIDVAYLSNNTYTFLKLVNTKILASFIAFNNIEVDSEFQCKYENIQIHEIDISQIIDQIQIELIQANLQTMEIFHLERLGDSYILKVHIVFWKYFSLILELSLDFNQFIVQQYRFLRYEKNSYLKEIVYQDKQFVLLRFQLELSRFINVYNIKGEQKNKDYLDSIQRVESQDLKKIEKYNDTHYVIYGKKFEKVFFMTLNQLKIECQGLCNEPANLTISNEVSSIVLEIKLDNPITFTFKLSIILANMIFIVIWIKFGQRVKRSQIKRKFNRICENQ